MICLWKYVRAAMFIIGAVLAIGGAGRSDYYLLALGQVEPQSVWVTIWIGVLLMIPMFIHSIRTYLKENKQ